MQRVNSALKAMLDFYYAQPNFRVMLLQNADTLAPQSTLKDFLAAEVAVDGYSRRPIAFGVSGTNEAVQALEFAEQTIVITAGPSVPIQFDGFVLIRAGAAIPQLAADSFTQAAPSSITFPSSPGPVGQQGIFRTTGALPVGIVAGTVYTIATIAGNVATFTAPNATPLSVSSLGSGTLKWVPLIGEIAMPFDLRPTDGAGNRTYTIQPNQPHNLRINLGLKIA
jgi:hypothetical protein